MRAGVVLADVLTDNAPTGLPLPGILQGILIKLVKTEQVGRGVDPSTEVAGNSGSLFETLSNRPASMQRLGRMP